MSKLHTHPTWRSATSLARGRACIGLAVLCIFWTWTILFLTITPATASSRLDHFEILAENELLVLYLNPHTTEIAVGVKATGDFWYSNPDFRGRRELLQIDYYTPRDERRTFNTYDHAVSINQYEVIPITNGVRIEYMLGREWPENARLPVMITKERLESAVLKHLPEHHVDFITGLYHLVMLSEKPEDYERVPVIHEQGGIGWRERTALDKEEVFGDYTLISPHQNLTTTQKQSLITLLLGRIAGGQPHVNSINEVRPHHLAHLIETPIYMLARGLTSWDLEDALTLLDQSGYGPLDATIDHEDNRIPPPMRNNEVFEIPIEFVLDGNSLVITIPMADVRYPRDVEITGRTYGTRGVYIGLAGEGFHTTIAEHFDRLGGDHISYPLFRIRLLEYFGAGTIDDNGFLFVPDGSGALIHMNCANTHGLTYYRPVYGADLTQVGLDPLQDQADHWLQKNRLPVFGLNKGPQAFLCVIESGSALAHIRARAVGQGYPFSTISTEFFVMAANEIQLATGTRSGSGHAIQVYPDDMFRGDLQLRYQFLSGCDASYVGMAKAYRAYLVDTHELTPFVPWNDIPFYLELIGAIQDVRLTMGVPRNISVPLTTYAEAEYILGQLASGGTANIHLRLTGWLEDGLHHQYPTQLQLESSIGGEASFVRFRDNLASQSIHLFPEVTFLHGLQELRSSALNPQRDIAQMVGGVRLLGRTDWGQGFLLSPARLPQIMETFLSQYQRLGLPHIALMDLGAHLHSDYREDEKLVTREQAMQIVVEELAALRSQGMQVMIRGGNSYALPYTSHLLDMPLNHSGLNIATESVPFFPIALHGYIPYAGSPANEAVDYRKHILRCLEVGAYPLYRWMYQDASVVKHTNFDYLYAAHYANWLDAALEDYQLLNAVLQPIQGVPIADHEQLGDSIYRTTYENGYTVTVDYNRYAVTVDGQSIATESTILDDTLSILEVERYE